MSSAGSLFPDTLVQSGLSTLTKPQYPGGMVYPPIHFVTALQELLTDFQGDRVVS